MNGKCKEKRSVEFDLRSVNLNTELANTAIWRTASPPQSRPLSGGSPNSTDTLSAVIETAAGLVLLHENFAPLEQVEDNTQRDQTDEPVLTQV